MKAKNPKKKLRIEKRLNVTFSSEHRVKKQFFYKITQKFDSGHLGTFLCDTWVIFPVFIHQKGSHFRFPSPSIKSDPAFQKGMEKTHEGSLIYSSTTSKVQ